MKIKSIYENIKNKINKRKKLFVFLSLLFTLIFAIFNRVIGAITGSFWHEAISIYYFGLALIRTIIYRYIFKSKNKINDERIFRIGKILLIILNILLTIPISLLVLNKRAVKMSLVFSIAIAFYVTIKTIKTIVNFKKYRKSDDNLVKQLKVIDLTDMVVSILTMQNTLIVVNGGFSDDLYILTIVVSFVGFVFNLLCVCLLRYKKPSSENKEFK